MESVNEVGESLSFVWTNTLITLAEGRLSEHFVIVETVIYSCTLQVLTDILYPYSKAFIAINCHFSLISATYYLLLASM